MLIELRNKAVSKISWRLKLLSNGYTQLIPQSDLKNLERIFKLSYCISWITRSPIFIRRFEYDGGGASYSSGTRILYSGSKKQLAALAKKYNLNIDTEELERTINSVKKDLSELEELRDSLRY